MNIQEWHAQNSYRDFKIGDYVRISPDLTAGMEYHDVFITNEMEYYRGLRTMIANIDEDGDITLTGDGEEYYWPKEVLTLARKEDMVLNDRLIVGDKVLINQNLRTLDDSKLPCYIMPQMVKHQGELAIITGVYVDDDFPEHTLYHIDRDEGEWSWPKEAFRERRWD